MSSVSDRSFVAGKRLAHPPSGDEVVISGISGRFPLSDNIKQFEMNLFNKTDMITLNRWNINHAEVPARGGKLDTINKFDCGAFSIHPQEAEIMGPLIRNLLEVVFEALYDAGVNPAELEGTKTGVFVPTLKTDCQEVMVKYDISKPKEIYAEIHRFTAANRISHILKLNGPSTTLDTGCSASLYALEQAYRAIRTGEIDAAIVGGVMMNLHPAGTAECFRQGFLCVDGRCKAFDVRANGYVKSEAVTAIFLQKHKHTKRNYGTIKHCKIGCDGFKEEGIGYPSAVDQALLFSRLYEECDVNPADVGFVEAHGTGTVVGDLQEATAIDCVLGNKRLLTVGSVKSNMGHAEQVAGMCEIAKAVIVMESGLIPPNLHYQEARRDIEALKEGRLQIPTKIVPFSDNGLIALNSFGLGGTNSHLLLKANDCIKTKSVIDCPRLICVSGRTYDAVKTILDEIALKPPNEDFFALLNDLHKCEIPQNRYRGTAIFANGTFRTSINKCDFRKTDLCLVFGDFNKNLVSLAHDILELPLGATICARVTKILQYDFKKLLYENQDRLLLSTLIQIIVLHLLQRLNANLNVISVAPCGIFAEIYFMNMLSFDEAIFFAILATELIGDDNFDSKYIDHLPANAEKNLVLKSVLRYLMKQHKPGKVPLDGNCEIFTIGRVDNNSQEEVSFLSALSRIYTNGINLDINKIYSRPHYPVARKTPMISPLIKWEHSRDFATISYDPPRIFHKLTRIDTNEARWNILHGHIVDGTKFFPGAGYLYLVWDAIAYKNGKAIIEMNVIFEDVKFLRATVIPSDGKMEFLISLHCASGEFTVFESGCEVFTGKVFVRTDSGETLTGTDEQIEDGLMVNEEDVYQELLLRGYNFGSVCKDIQKCSIDFVKGFVKWHNNWVAFMDSVLQLYILPIPTRNLLLLSNIRKITIEPKLHGGCKDFIFSYNFNKATQTLKCGGVEITDAKFNAIPRKTSPKRPVLEEHKFVSNNTNLHVEGSIRVNMQIALELNYKSSIRIVEISDGTKNLLPCVIRSLANDPVVEVEAVLLSKDKITYPQVKIEDNPIENLKGVYMVIGRQIISTGKLETIFPVLIENGYILSREPLSNTNNYPNLNILTVHTTPVERFVLLTKSFATPLYQTLEITKNFEWIKPLQKMLRSEDEIIIYSHDENTGIIGLSRTLRQEGKKIRCILICDPQAPIFTPSNAFYNKQLKKGFATNIFRDGSWGTYCCFAAKPITKVKSEHCFLKSNLEKSNWIVGPLNLEMNLKPHQELVHVYYSGLSHKDAVLANTRNESFLGMEYSGKLNDGTKVMGIIPNGGAVANVIAIDRDLMLEVPKQWTLEEAATVPLAYAVTLYALNKINTKKNQSVLIYCVADGVGLAAIYVCYSLGLNVFAIVDDEVKKATLQKALPQVDTVHVGYSGDVGFKRFLKRTTKGRGVDLVLRSLTDTNHNDGLSCLTKKGIYLVINTSNCSDEKSLPLEVLSKEIQLHSISIDSLLKSGKTQEIMNLLKKGVKDGIVKPLIRNVAYESGIVGALKSIVTGQNFEKVLIKVRPEDRNIKPLPRLLHGTARYYPNGSIVVTGGLGGFGMELINWLVKRGATNIIIASRRATLTGYETSRLNIWKQKGARIQITTEDITTEEGCKVVLKNASNMAALGAIFHLAAVFNDALFEHQTEENFKRVFAVKTQTLQHFDKLTRRFHTSLRDFVVFSSISSVRPNPGQTNYVYANSAMERICEKRNADGLSAVAIQWGIVGDVGIVHRAKDKQSISDISGLMPQSISSCLEVLDEILTQKPNIISSAVFKKKRTIASSNNNIVDHVANIIGIKDLKTINTNATLAELGMDSITATVIRQKLEREFEIVLSFKELRRQTFAGLQQLLKKTENKRF